MADLAVGMMLARASWGTVVPAVLSLAVGCFGNREVHVRAVSSPSGAAICAHFPPGEEIGLGTTPIEKRVRLPDTVGFLEARADGHERAVRLLDPSRAVESTLQLAPKVGSTIPNEQHADADYDQSAAILEMCLGLRGDEPIEAREVAERLRSASATIDHSGRSCLGDALRELAARCDVLGEVRERRLSWHVQVYAEELVISLARDTMVAVLIARG